MELIVAFTMLIALATAILAVSRATGIGSLPLWGSAPKPVQAFPTPSSPARHWTRVTGVIELALQRAGDVSSHQAAAIRQLEAADYALHCLLAELADVMPTTVVSPLVAKTRPAAEPPRSMATALAA